jgi:small subunit ribosomal protein S6
MTLPAPTYDLVMLLDPEAEEPARAKIIADTRAAIEADGEFLRHDGWGDRALTYPIDRKAVAEYHLMQFHAEAPALLSELDRTLRITDGIMRFRIIKLKPGVPEAPEVLGSAAPERQAEPETVVEDGLETEILAEEVAEEVAVEAAAEAIVEAAETEAVAETIADAVVEAAESEADAETAAATVLDAVESEAVAPPEPDAADTDE